LALVVFFAAGCTSVPTTPEVPVSPAGPPLGPYAPSAPGAPIPPANINLQAFPPEYRHGYADGCASATGAERKDAPRFRSDGQYRTGWQDGNALCKKP